MRFQASLLSEGTEGYGDARSRALYSQVMLHTFGQHGSHPGVSYGAVDPELISSLTQAGVSLLGTGIQAGVSAVKAGKDRKAAAAAAEAATKQAEADAKKLEQEAKIAATQSAEKQKTLMVVGGIGIAVIAVGGLLGAVYLTSRKA